MIFLALSCLQSRPQSAAFSELSAMPVDGIQLTPGCLPSENFRSVVDAYDGAIRMHHGFAWDAYRRDVYDADLRPVGIGRDHSVHPPPLTPTEGPKPAWRSLRRPQGEEPRAPAYDSAAWLEVAVEENLLVETMYPGETLGTGDELERAIEMGLRLAVDVSHLNIQREAGALTDAQLRRLLDYTGIEEVHVSHNDGQRDQHRALTSSSYLLDWARERSRNLPVVLESYWHRATQEERSRQLQLLAGRRWAVEM